MHSFFETAHKDTATMHSTTNIPTSNTHRFTRNTRSAIIRSNGGALLVLLFFIFTASSARAADIFVTNANDSGAGSLRQAITNANATPAADTIKFQIAAASKVINLTSPLPTITQPLTIDGTTQAGYTTTPLIELNGTAAGNSPGLYIAASNSAVKALAINRFNGDGILLSNGGGGNVITNCFIGTDTTGTIDRGNTGNGITISNSDNNLIGTTTTTRNLISGNNSNGVSIFNGATGNSVRGNLIGTNLAGTTALANNGSGVSINAAGNIIGGAGATQRNIISGNGSSGIAINGATSTGNTIKGNYIGTNLAGTAAVPNASTGIRNINAANTVIGGAPAAERNVISGNARGISIEGATATGCFIVNNYVGTNAAGTAAVPNAQSGVDIYSPNNSIKLNVISGNGSNGFTISGSTGGNIVQGNYIGTNAAGTAAISNASSGVSITDSSNNTIGGSLAAERNLISGNVRGISLSGTGNTVQGNYIGTNAAGNAAIANTQGGLLIYAADNTITGNLISGNAGGISIEGATSTGNTISSNLIGTNAAGSQSLPNSGYGIRILDAPNNTIGGASSSARNVISGNERSIGIESTGNTVRNNYIGTDATGSFALQNVQSGVEVSGSNNTVMNNLISGNSNGLSINSNATGNTIAGNLFGTNASGQAKIAADAIAIRIYEGIGNTISSNLISNHRRGITIERTSTGNIIQGNYIGTDISGTLDFGNIESGISLGAAGNQIGGTLAGQGNVISGNNTGIHFSGVPATGNTVQGNFIGTKPDGTLGNVGNSYAGIYIDAASDNLIGGTQAGAGNTVAGNYRGVFVYAGTGNRIVGNSFFGNELVGIDTTRSASNPTTRATPTQGGNRRQNYPVLSSVINNGGNTTFTGKLTSTANREFRVEFFSNTECDASGFGEGKTLLGFTKVTTDNKGAGDINATLAVAPVGNFVTAIATDILSKDSSEFSPCALVGGANPGVFQFSLNPYVFQEYENSILITVTRSQGNTGAATVTYATSNGSAVAPDDYGARTGTLQFADGEVVKTFAIPVTLDAIDEGNQEDLFVTLSNPTDGAGLGAQSTAKIIIIDYEDTFPIVNFFDASVIEGNDGARNAVFNITITPHSAPITIGYKTIAASATAGVDFTETTGEITLAPGENSKTVSVPVIGDTDAEADEIFYLQITDLKGGAGVSDGLAEAVIVNDDAGAPGTPVATSLFSDAFVRGAQATTNFGASTELQVKRTLNPGNGKGRQSYLRFDTTGITGTIASAKLRVFGRMNAPGPNNLNTFIPCAVFPVSAAWDEAC
jgi:parallel beta-helix repeat protein